MKWWVACTFVLGAVSAYAQSPPAKVAIATEDDYSKAMKEIGALNGSLRKSLATPSGADASAAAARLETIFKDIEAYWEDKHVEDATTAAKNAVAASQAIAKAVAAHDTAAATAGAQSLGSTCTACHTAHRERLTYDFYRMK
jgi:cytochrome c1